jgi:PPOX class probable F420-dependent enzyme
MPAEGELWDLVASRREGVLATIRHDGLPQLTNVLYLPGPGGRTVRISTTADRLKARILARDPRAMLHVSGDNFWAYAVAEGHATLTPAAAEPGDAACRELLEVHSALYGPQDENEFYAEMIARRRLVIRLDLEHVYGVITSAGRRPLRVPDGAQRLPSSAWPAHALTPRCASSLPTSATFTGPAPRRPAACSAGSQGPSGSGCRTGRLEPAVRRRRLAEEGRQGTRMIFPRRWPA